MEDNDSQLQLKKRARRRLVGAVVFASVVAVVLPMIMDHQPRQVVQDVEIRIPGQDEKPFAPKFAVAPVEKAAPADDDKPAPESAAAVPSARIVESGKDKAAEKPVAEKALEQTPEKPSAKPEKLPEKPSDKPAAKTTDADAKRAAALLAGQAPAEQQPAKSGEYVILIGAFASEENVRSLKAKLAEKNIRTYTEPLDTPAGKRTRVRAGPFPSREAAEKALEKMKQVGVSGVISGK
jgi:DedD protein